MPKSYFNAMELELRLDRDIESVDYAHLERLGEGHRDLDSRYSYQRTPDKGNCRFLYSKAPAVFACTLPPTVTNNVQQALRRRCVDDGGRGKKPT